MRYKTFDCKFHELDKRLNDYANEEYLLHSFALLNVGFNERAYVVVERREKEKAE